MKNKVYLCPRDGLIKVRVMNNFLENLRHYFENNPQEKILEDWEKTKEFDQVGVLLEDFLNSIHKYQPSSVVIKTNENITNSYSPKFSSGFLLKIPKYAKGFFFN